MQTVLRFFAVREFILLAVVFVPAERLFALRRGQRILRRGWSNDLVYVLANRGPLLVGLMATTVIAGEVAHRFVPVWLQTAVAGQWLVAQVAEAVVLADLGFYFAHRMFHSIPLLWRFHAIHHSIEELDWLAAVRIHPVDQAMTKMISMLPLYALGIRRRRSRCSPPSTSGIRFCSTRTSGSCWALCPG